MLAGSWLLLLPGCAALATAPCMPLFCCMGTVLYCTRGDILLRRGLMIEHGNRILVHGGDVGTLFCGLGGVYCCTGAILEAYYAAGASYSAAVG